MTASRAFIDFYLLLVLFRLDKDLFLVPSFYEVKKVFEGHVNLISL